MGTTRKLKQKEVKEFREELRKKNNQRCVLCGEPLSYEDAALDHDHKTGYCRDTIHKDCNILLGKIENYIRRYGKRFREKEILEEFLRNTSEYLFKDYSDMPFHPTHRTPEDKQIREWKQRMKRAKRHETKEKYKRLIKEYNSES